MGEGEKYSIKSPFFAIFFLSFPTKTNNDDDIVGLSSEPT